jgi:hypothetical protein
MRSTTWMAVLPTSPVDLGGLMGLLVFIDFIVAISNEIAYYEIQFYKSNPVNSGDAAMSCAVLGSI